MAGKFGPIIKHNRSKPGICIHYKLFLNIQPKPVQMKRLIPFILIIMLLAICCSRKDGLTPRGAWQMVQMQLVENGKVTNYFSDRYVVNQTKVWDGNHFIFVGKYQVDTTTTYRYGVGTWTLEGNIYEEDIKYHFDKAYEGIKNKIWLEIRKDTLLHIFPVNDAGTPNQKHWVERYVRVK